jgi:hypothetical protein
MVVAQDGVMSRKKGPRSGGPRARRSFTPGQKLELLAVYEQAVAAGEGGAFLRREGLYSSLMSEWRRTRDAGLLQGKAAGETVGRPVTDPEARLTTLNCDGALHHAHVALRAQGWDATVTRLPRDGATAALARIRVGGRAPADPAAVEYLRTTRLPTRRPDQILDLAAAVDHAQRGEAGDPAWRAELAGWAGGTRPSGSGVPDAAIPNRATQTTVPAATSPLQ